MRRPLTALALVAILAATTAAGAESSHRSVVKFTVKISQGPTFRHPNPPDGDAGDVFSTTLTEFATGSLFGKAAGTKVGSMSFSKTAQLTGTLAGRGASASLVALPRLS